MQAVDVAGKLRLMVFKADVVMEEKDKRLYSRGS